jgi:phosphatidylserine decarboxylase
MLPLTRHGTREMVIGTIVLLVIGFLLGRFVHPYLSLLVLPVLIWLFAFFRDPERPITTEPHLMVSPADGMVSDVGEVDSEHIGERCLRIGIFLNVFNVHVNRAPCDGKVTNVIYKKGKFINAMSHGAASSDNESNTLILEADGKPVAVIKQIVGLIARRIICTSKAGDTLKRGERFGMIKFGSRTELYIPLRLNPSASVNVGQKVRGGLDIIARLSPSTSSEAPATPIGASA